MNRILSLYAIISSFLFAWSFLQPSLLVQSFVQPINVIASRRQSASYAYGINDSSKPDSPGYRTKAATPEDRYDVIVVGSGLGGLSCAAMLALYGYSVAVLESHTHPGGAAHGYSMSTKKNKDEQFQFDTGPSFFSGLNPNLPAKASNPLRTVLDAIGEKVECIPYSTFGLVLPEGEFIHTPGFGREGGVLDQVAAASAGQHSSSPDTDTDKTAALKQWKTLMERMEPLAAAVAALPTAALRADVGVLLTAAPFLPDLVDPTKINKPWDNLLLTKPFTDILQQAGVQNEFLKNWIDLLCFCLSGLPADGTITAEMAMMMGEFYEPDAL
jgi:phytoene dehydrogenase-like protein